MAEISEREYESLLRALEATNTSMASINSQFNGLAIRLAEHYMPREEDEKDDTNREKRLYEYIHDVVRNLDGKIKILQWVIGIQFTLLAVLLGIEHTLAK